MNKSYVHSSCFATDIRKLDDVHYLPCTKAHNDESSHNESSYQNTSND